MPWKLLALVALLGSLWFFFHELLPVSASPDEPLIRVAKDDKFGFINPKGRLVFPFQWDDVHDFDEDGFAYVENDNRWEWIDRKGNTGIKQRDGESSFVSAWELIEFGCDGKRGWKDDSGKVIIEPNWEGFLISEDRSLPGKRNPYCIGTCTLSPTFIHRVWGFLTSNPSFPPSYLYVCFDAKGQVIWRSDQQERERLWGMLLGGMALGLFFYGRRKGRNRLKDPPAQSP